MNSILLDEPCFCCHIDTNILNIPTLCTLFTALSGNGTMRYERLDRICVHNLVLLAHPEQPADMGLCLGLGTDVTFYAESTSKSLSLKPDQSSNLLKPCEFTLSHYDGHHGCKFDYFNFRLWMSNTSRPASFCCAKTTYRHTPCWFTNLDNLKSKPTIRWQMLGWTAVATS